MWQTKLALKRFLDSLLQKSGKIRGLIRELSEQYSSADSTASWAPQICFNGLLCKRALNEYTTRYINLYICRNVAKLREQLKLMDSEYDSCQSVQVYGEINNWNAESLACIYFVIAFQVTQTILCVAPRFVQKATKAMNKATETSGAYIEYTFAASWPHHVHQKVLYIHVPICRCSKAVGLEMKIRSSPKSSLVR